MEFIRHKELEGMHSYLSASNFHWINYSDEKLLQSYQNFLGVERGTELHELAAKLISLGIKLPRTKKTLNMYVNDAIGYGLRTEQVLYYSPYAFGTTDGISFENNLLRIHDLKTGVTPAHMEQLMIYAAYFCLEYQVDPLTIKYELRLYQNDDIIIYIPEGQEIKDIMEKIIRFNKIITDYNNSKY